MRTLGTMNPGPLIFSDPLTTMVLPCTYGTTWTDTYADPNAQGERTYTADGYGTLVGPGGSFSDVLKVHSEYTSLDTIINGVNYEGLVVQDVFWRSAIGWPLVTSIRSIVFVDGQPIQDTWVGSAVELFFTDVHELSAETTVQVWPNPSAGLFEFSSGHEYSFTVFSSCGASILIGNSSVIDLSSQPTGIYSAVISDGQGRRTLRLLVER